MREPIRMTALKRSKEFAFKGRRRRWGATRPPEAGSGPKRKPASASGARPWLIRPTKLLWIPAVGAIWLVVATYGTPHLRFQYNWTPLPGYSDATPDRFRFNWCDYVGLHPRRIVPDGGGCPLVRLMRAESEE